MGEGRVHHSPAGEEGLAGVYHTVAPIRDSAKLLGRLSLAKRDKTFHDKT